MVELKNKVYLKKGKFHVFSIKDANQYAFYLHYKQGVEKKLYSYNNEHIFEKNIEDGVYTIVFYKKLNNNDVISHREIVIVKNNSILEMEVLSETDGYKISYYDNASDITFIVFNGTGSTKKTHPFGLNYLLSKGYNVITCAQNANQYQGLSYNDFKKIVTPYVEKKKVFLYGSSLGGYCSIYYSGAVNGTVIAAAPKNSAHPRMIKGRSKFKKEDFRHSDIIENKITNKPVYVIVDPKVSTDIFFIDTFIKPAYPNINIVEVPYAGHEVLFHVNKTKKLSPIINMIVKGENPCTSGIVFDDVNTEFTYFGKALDSYRDLVGYIQKIDSEESIHPTIVKKLQWLRNKLKVI